MVVGVHDASDGHIQLGDFNHDDARARSVETMETLSLGTSARNTACMQQVDVCCYAYSTRKQSQRFDLDSKILKNVSLSGAEKKKKEHAK
jgi:hypothetical protein